MNRFRAIEKLNKGFFQLFFYELHSIGASLLDMKTKILLVILSFALSTFVSAETVYKTRDAEGNIIFSDVPSEGAETIEIEEVQTLKIPEAKRLDDRPTTKLTPKETIYTRLEITSPENDATIRSNEGIVNISVEMEPVLDEKHAIVFLMDGKEVSSGKSLQLSLKDLVRGTHTVTAIVKNEKDKVLKRSGKLVFHLHKDSKLFKNRTNENANTPNNSDTVPASPDDSSSELASPEIPSL